MGRKRLVPGHDYGRSLYDWMKFQRREDDSTAWEAEDLSEWLGQHDVAISGKQLREWIKKKYPRLDKAAAIADLFGTTLDEMWRHTGKPINLPQGRGSLTQRPAGEVGGGRTAAVHEREELAKKARRTARTAQQERPGRTGSQ